MPANYTHTTRAAGLTLTATIYNQDHQNHIDNMIPGVIDDYSVNVAQMQETLDPGEVGTENPAASLADELKQLRFCLKELKGTTNWYESVSSSIAFLGANVFTALQRIVAAIAGPLLELESSEAGALSGPDIDQYRNSASPAASDQLGRINFWGKDSTAVKTLFGRVYSKLMDPTNGSEDGAVGIGTLRAGVLSDWAFVSGAFHHSSLAVPAEEGALAATKYYMSNTAIAGMVVQDLYDEEATYVTLSTIVPDDDTIPQITEGTNTGLEIIITPKKIGNRIRVEFDGSFGGGGNQTILVGLFAVGTNNALRTAIGAIAGAGSNNTQISLKYETTAASLDPITYRIRAGAAAANDVWLNGNNGGRQLGGATAAVLTVKEIWV